MVDEELTKAIDELTEFPPGLAEEDKEEETPTPEPKEKVEEAPQEVEAKSEEPPKVEAKKEEKPLEPEEDELTVARKEIDALRAQLEVMAEGRFAEPPKPKEEVRPKVEEPRDIETISIPQAVQRPEAEIDFVKDVDLEEFISNKQTLNRVLNNVYRTAFENGRRISVEEALRHIPEVVKHNVVQQVTLRAATDDFYARNQDLQPYKKVVAVVAEALAASNPDWPLEKLFSETEVETRKRLLLHKRATEIATPVVTPPPRFAKVGKGTGKQAGDTRTDFQKQIDDLISEVR